MTSQVYVLGGYQTDFSQNWARNGLELFDAFGQKSGVRATDSGDRVHDDGVKLALQKFQ